MFLKKKKLTIEWEYYFSIYPTMVDSLIQEKKMRVITPSN